MGQAHTVTWYTRLCNSCTWDEMTLINVCVHPAVLRANQNLAESTSAQPAGLHSWHEKQKITIWWNGTAMLWPRLCFPLGLALIGCLLPHTTGLIGCFIKHGDMLINKLEGWFILFVFLTKYYKILHILFIHFTFQLCSSIHFSSSHCGLSGSFCYQIILVDPKLFLLFSYKLTKVIF